MTGLRAACAASLLALLAACGSEPQALPGAGLLGKLMPSAGATAPAPAPDSGLFLQLMGQRQAVPLSLIQRSGSVTVWRDAAGRTVTLRDGVIAATAGYGFDLASAATPSAAQLMRAGSSHLRRYVYTTGEDAPGGFTASCTVAAAPAGSPNPAPGTRHMVESCSTGGTKVDNHYFIGAQGKIVLSQQFVSPGIGVVTLVRR